jgi:hypothetical protein
MNPAKLMELLKNPEVVFTHGKSGNILPRKKVCMFMINMPKNGSEYNGCTKDGCTADHFFTASNGGVKFAKSVTNPPNTPTKNICVPVKDAKTSGGGSANSVEQDVKVTDSNTTSGAHANGGLKIGGGSASSGVDAAKAPNSAFSVEESKDDGTSASVFSTEAKNVGGGQSCDASTKLKLSKEKVKCTKCTTIKMADKNKCGFNHSHLCSPCDKKIGSGDAKPSADGNDFTHDQCIRGELLYPIVAKAFPERAGKITAMLLESYHIKILDGYLKNEVLLQQIISDAYNLLIKQ